MRRVWLCLYIPPPNKTSPEPALLQAQQPQLSEPLLLSEMLQAPSHLHGPLLDLPQHVPVSSGTRKPGTGYFLLGSINSKNHAHVDWSICRNGHSGTDDLRSRSESVRGGEVVPKQTDFIFGAKGALAGVGFSFGTEAALAGEENLSTHRLLIYNLIVRGLREITHFQRPLGRIRW